MKITHAEDSRQANNTIRGGARMFKTMLVGSEESLSNYKLSLVRQAGVLDIPRHKHNFDQIRVCLEGGPQNYGAEKWIKAGNLVYFPEGTPYGPERSDTERLSITLQFGGASGSGYIGPDKTVRCVEQMQKFGSFANGVFRRNGELAAGQARAQDSYEAIWEFINGRRIAYPPARFDEPICICPANFAWRPDSNASKVWHKGLASFSERDFSIRITKWDPGGCSTLPAHKAEQLGFVLDGLGTANEQLIKKYSAFSVQAQEKCEIKSKDGIEILLFSLHVF